MRLPVKFRRSSLLTKVVVLLVVVSATVILVSQRSQIRSNQAQCQELAGQAAELPAGKPKSPDRHRRSGFGCEREENRPG